MSDSMDTGKIRWKCRRGMLELDIILEQFYDMRFSALTPVEKELFNQLLDEPDPLLYGWLLGHQVPENPQHSIIVNKIRQGK